LPAPLGTVTLMWNQIRQGSVQPHTTSPGGAVEAVTVSRRVHALLFSDIVGARTVFGIWDASWASSSLTCAPSMPRTPRALL
jgi:hypothetical protein